MLDILDRLLKRQRWIERSLTNRRVKDATLILCDATSRVLEGQRCPLAAFGHNCDGKKGKMQIVFGLLVASDGCPVVIEVCPGNTGDRTSEGPWGIASQEIRPVLHQPAPSLEQVRPPVSRLDLVSDHMR